MSSFEQTEGIGRRKIVLFNPMLNPMPTVSPLAPLRVLLVDDFQPFRHALRTLFSRYTAIEVIGEAADGNSAVEMALRLVPEAIIMNAQLPRLNGIEATRRIKRVLPSVHVVGVSSQGDIVTKEAMTTTGWSAFIVKERAHTLPVVLAKLTGRPIAENACEGVL